MGRIYTVPMVLSTITAAGGNTDLAELTPADDKPIHVRQIRLGQTSELGDAAEEGADLTIEHLAATVTSGNGSAVTPVPADSAVNVAAGFTAEVNGATVGTTSGTKTILETLPWNIRNTPCEWSWWHLAAEYCPTARQAAALVLRMNNTLADDVSMSGTIWVEED